jgi:hypothetical protein
MCGPRTGKGDSRVRRQRLVAQKVVPGDDDVRR